MTNIFGQDMFGNEVKQQVSSVIAKKFIIPPFSVLNCRDGVWQERKRAWVGLGIKSEVGRDCKVFAIGDKEQWTREQKEKGGLTYKGMVASFDSYRVKEGTRNHTDTQGTSIFDPVLTECAYTWFCPPKGHILDPFCGGSVRGIVASLLDYKYTGYDLRREQIDANFQQGLAICPDNIPDWQTGDALELLDNAPMSDFIFSCPPYGDLEVYSDDPRDLSNMEYHTFVFKLKRIILKCYQHLKNNRFACFVVGDFRDKQGFYRNFVSDTISGFLECGMKLYNEIILVTSVGSLPIRITNQFNSSRKIGKTHQNVLVFVKGDPKQATKEINA